MPVCKEPFGVTRDGRPVDKFTLRRGALEAEILTYGAALRALRVPDRDGKPVDVVLGYDTVESYETNGGYVGAVVGRYANRIAGAGCLIDGRRVSLVPNEGGKQLHGGPEGFSKQVFAAEASGEDSVTLTYVSPGGQGGFPGQLTLRVTYTLTGSALRLRYEAASTETTHCNITNHAYFNLNGGGDAMDHVLWLASGAYTPVGPDSIPLDMSRPAAGTPLDFTVPKPLSRDIGADDEQLRNVGGYDHNFVLSPAQGLRLAARLAGPQRHRHGDLDGEAGDSVLQRQLPERQGRQGGRGLRPADGRVSGDPVFPGQPQSSRMGRYPSPARTAVRLYHRVPVPRRRKAGGDVTEERSLRSPENLARLAKLRLMDDDFMTRCFESDPACVELVLRIVLDMPELTVRSVRTQVPVSNLTERSLRMDVVAIDSAGRTINVEIQRSDRGAGRRRARFHSSMLDSVLLQKSEDFQRLPETWVIFITERDVLGRGEPLYKVERCILNTGELFDDGAHILYVNGAFRDDSPLGWLMHDFSGDRAADVHYAVVEGRVRYFKETM